MPRVIFWDVDTQYDFMKADGKLAWAWHCHCRECG